MTAHLGALCFDALDPAGLAAFWGGVLQRDIGRDDRGRPVVLPRREVQFPLAFTTTDVAKTWPNQMHFDLTSARPEDQQATVDRVLELGGCHIDVGQRPEEGHVVMADPEGNELCIIPSGNNFTADTDSIGAVSSDGTQAVGYFWAKALDWPLVWDQDEETAIQAPAGGSKIAWGGPPLDPKYGKNRLHLELVADDASEVERLESLGAKRIDIGQGDVPWVVMADPDGNEFCLLGSR